MYPAWLNGTVFRRNEWLKENHCAMHSIQVNTAELAMTSKIKFSQNLFIICQICGI